MATMCCERAGDEMWEKWSKAASLKETADHMHGLNPEKACIILNQASDIFISLSERLTLLLNVITSGGNTKKQEEFTWKNVNKLQNAGECFFLAGCYKLAAEVYAKGNYFSECLTVCSKAKLFDEGLQYICCWKQLHHGNNLTTFKGEELGDIEQGFHESCAVHYYERKDKRSMMNFFKGFNSIDSKRNFLTNLNCLDEVLLVEEDLGNFREAIEIAKLKGELLLEAELHKKAKNFKEAAMLMLWSVFANSL